MTTGIILQARMGSSRLPGKMLLPFSEGRSLFETLLERVVSSGIRPLAVATGDGRENDPLEAIAKNLGVDCFRGSELDVRRRFIDCAAAFGMGKIIRACGDNPFLDMDALKTLHRIMDADDESDYIGFRAGERPAILTHFGFWCEAFTFSAISRAEKENDAAIYREHVTNIFYRSPPGTFRLRWLDADPVLAGRGDIRLTLDDAGDFERLRTIYAAMAESGSPLTIAGVVEYLDRHPETRAAMADAIAAHPK